MAKLGAVVTVTDLKSNLPLLQHNCKTNGEAVVLLGWLAEGLHHLCTLDTALPTILLYLLCCPVATVCKK